MKRTRLLSILLAVVSLTGCAGSIAYYSPAPPPPPRAEFFGVAPGPGYVWINGYWGWGSNAYVWVPGRWERPPRAHATWVAPSWERQGRHYRLRHGHWR
jgi:hypothetical protein